MCALETGSETTSVILKLRTDWLNTPDHQRQALPVVIANELLRQNPAWRTTIDPDRRATADLAYQVTVNALGDSTTHAERGHLGLFFKATIGVTAESRERWLLSFKRAGMLLWLKLDEDPEDALEGWVRDWAPGISPDGYRLQVGRALADWYSSRYDPARSMYCLATCAATNPRDNSRASRVTRWLPWSAPALAASSAAAVWAANSWLALGSGQETAFWSLLVGAVVLLAAHTLGSLLVMSLAGADLRMLDILRLNVTRMVPATAVGTTLLLAGPDSVGPWLLRMQWVWAGLALVVTWIYVALEVHKRLLGNKARRSLTVALRSLGALAVGYAWALIGSTIAVTIALPQDGGEALSGELLHPVSTFGLKLADWPMTVRLASIALLLGFMLQLIWEDKSATQGL